MKKKTATSTFPREKVVMLYRTALKTGIPLETVHQKMAYLEEREQVVEKTDQEEQLRKWKAMPVKKRIFFTVVPILCIFLGLGLVGSALWPILTYYVFPSDDLYRASLLAPIPNDQVRSVMPRIVVQAQETETGEVLGANRSGTYVAPTILNDDLDYTNLSNWFPNLALPNLEENKTLEYTIDIPKVKITNAKVQMGGSNLDKNLIQYPGTSLPGDFGNPVIFGHSILRQFYNPSEKNPNRYLSIFSTIMTLSKGDKIYVKLGNVKYTYEVVEKRVVHPEDTYILDQQYSDRQIKLVTCVPEGTTQDRGVVIAQLIQES